MIKDMWPAVLRGILGLGLFAVAWFGAAGRLDWFQGWAILAFFTLFVAGLSWRLARVNPDLLRERNRPGGTVERWDLVVLRLYYVVLVFQLGLSALDSGRFHWSSVPVGVQVLGWVLLAMSGADLWWVMLENAYLSSWARLQEDRGQVVVSTGPYRWVRHPMYLGIMVAFVGMSLALASWWALLLGLINVGLFVYRTHREDEMLKDGLTGYGEYATKVRFRLIPGIW